MPAPKKSATLHVVERLNWCPQEDLLLRLPGSTRLQSFADADEADQDRLRREQATRLQVNPFICGGPALHYQTSLDEGRLCDWLLDTGLTPPEPNRKGRRDWPAWWKKSSPAFTAHQRDRVWEGLDRVRFFEVVERAAKPVVYLVVRIGWRYNDEWYEAEQEGGTMFPTYYAFRDRTRAEEACAENNDMRREMWADDEDEDDPLFDVNLRRDRREGVLESRNYIRGPWESFLLPRTQTPFWEVIEVEVDDL
jgi:hypothetical protein